MRLLKSRTFLAAAGAALAAVIAGACGSSNPSQPSPACTFALSAPSQSFSSDGGQGSVGLTTDASCTWTVAGAADWVSVTSGTAGTGPATIHFSVAANAAGGDREMVLTVATMPFRVTQTGRTACTFSVAPASASIGKDGGTSEVSVTADAACAWTAASDAPWITLLTGAGGRGSATVRFAVSENNATEARSGTLLVANHRITVEQAGEQAPQADCEYSVSPVSFEPCMPAGVLTARLDTGPTCRWTVESDSAWLSIPGALQGTGSRTFSIGYTDNYDAPREGVVMLRWPTPTAGQNIHVNQAGCTYGVSQRAISIAAAGGTSSFDVVQESQPNVCGGPTQDRCVWTARSSASWITITTAMPRTGDDSVRFTVAANTTGSARSATIAVRSQTVSVTQAAQ